MCRSWHLEKALAFLTLARLYRQQLGTWYRWYRCTYGSSRSARRRTGEPVEEDPRRGRAVLLAGEDKEALAVALGLGALALGRRYLDASRS